MDGVTLARDGRQVLGQIDWTTAAGEHWVVMGNNGSGKTTLMELLMGYLWPQKGSVAVLGRTFGKSCLPDLRKRIGYVSPWIFKRVRDDMPVESVVASGTEAGAVYYERISAGLRGEIRKRLGDFNCLSVRTRPFGKISSGQQIKVMIARALINHPEVLILDEPFSWLDMGARLAAYKLIERLGRLPRGPQMILVTHYLEDILPCFSHGLLLKDGRVYAQGPLDKILTPGHVAGALGVPKSLGQPFVKAFRRNS